MYKNKISLFLLLTVVMTSLAYSQQNPDKLKVEEASGTVLKVDAEANVLVLKSFMGQMSFFVPKDAIIARETRPVTIAEVREGDSVSIRYYSSSDAVYVVMSINDSKVIPVNKT